MTPFAPALAPAFQPPADPAHLRALEDGIAELTAQIDAATHRLLRMLLEFDHLRGWAPGGFRSCAEWLSWRTGMAPGAARERVRVARALEALPRVSEALARGELSYAKARALTRVARPETEERLLAFADDATAAQTERLVAGWARLDREAAVDGASAREAEAMRHAARYLHLFPDSADGSWTLKGRLDPEVGMLLRKALELAAESLFRGSAGEAPDPVAARRADALGLLAETALRAGVGMEGEEGRTTGRADRFQVILHVSAETSGGGTAEPRADAQARAALRPDALLPAPTRDRLACDASRVMVREAPDGSPLSVGRRTRIVPPHIRRALDLRDGGCRFPGCGNRICDAHHVIPWQEGGPTELDNLVLLCRRHHRLLHEGGFRMALRTKSRADGGASVVRFVDPEGREVRAAPPRPRLRGDASEELRAAAEAEGVRIHSETNFPRWDGTRLDLGYALWALWRPAPAGGGTGCSPETRSVPCLPLPSPPVPEPGP
jgi:hypothetical protein